MPRKKKSPPEFPATEPVSLASPLDVVITQARCAEQTLEAEPLIQGVVATPEPVPERPAPQVPRNGTDLDFATRARPTGPRQRHPCEPRTVFASPEAGFKLGQTPHERLFKFDDDRPPSSEEKGALQYHGFSYRPVGKVWAAPSTPETREASDSLALRLSGKAAKMGHDR